MEIKVRNLNVVTVKKINEMAAEKKMSRNDFLRVHIENLTHDDVLKEDRNRFEEAIKMNTKVIDVFAETQNELLERVGNIERMILQVIKSNSTTGVT